MENLKEVKIEPKGLGGWLVLCHISIWSTILSGLGCIFIDGFMTEGLKVDWLSRIFGIVICIIFGFLGYLFYNKRKIFASIMKWKAFLLTVCTTLVLVCVPFMEKEKEQWVGIFFLVVILFSLPWFIIWKYWQKSKRVKNTFVN